MNTFLEIPKFRLNISPICPFFAMAISPICPSVIVIFFLFSFSVDSFLYKVERQKKRKRYKFLLLEYCASYIILLLTIPIYMMSLSFSKNDFYEEIKSIASASTTGASSSSSGTLSRDVAKLLDQRDPLAPLRDGYILPSMKDANVVDPAGKCQVSLTTTTTTFGATNLIICCRT